MKSPETIYIDDRAKAYPFTKKICAYFPNVVTEIIKDTKKFIKHFNKKPAAIEQGKKSFFITINKGKFLKKCPGTKNYICCGYQILYPASQCNLDCSYCILQSYFNNPLITFFANTDDMLYELSERLTQNRNRLWRIGTGEFTDSLAFDSITHLSTQLIPFFSKHPNAILELKSKATYINNLLKYRPCGNVVLAFSLNSNHIVQQEEHFAASITERLKSAALCARQGYKLAFHFDPIFYYDGWEKEYKQTIDTIYSHIPSHKIVWISLGCFRFMPALKKIVAARFPHSSFIYNEFIVGQDGKMRYPKPIRIHIYRTMFTYIKKNDSNAFIYLCMESPDVWKHAFGYTPRRFGNLTKALDAQVFPKSP